MSREEVDAFLVCVGYLTLQNRQQIVTMATQHQLPAMYSFWEFVEVGGLMAYSPNLADMYRRAATPVDKILKGATPAGEDRRAQTAQSVRPSRADGQDDAHRPRHANS